MNWRDVLVGSIATLLVTILGGVGVYYLTKEKPAEKSERLIYRVEDSGQFSGNEKSIGVITVYIENLGNLPAVNLAARVWFNAELISDHKITVSGGDNSRIHLDQASAKEIGISMQRLYPGESLKVLMLTSSSAIRPKVTAHSDSSVGKEEDVTSLKPSSSEKSGWFILFSPFIIGVTVPFGGLVSIWVFNRFVRRNLSRHLGRKSTLNNIAFCLLHSGGTKEAHELFESAVQKAEDAPHCMANFALTSGILGRHDSAELWLRAADFYSNTDHEKAVVSLNRGILLALSGSIDLACVEFKKAVTLSKDEILHYATFSSIIAPLIGAEEKIKAVFSISSEKSTKAKSS